MRNNISKVIGLVAVLLLSAVSAGVQQSSGGLSAYLPASGEAAGWSLEGEPQSFQGEDLFMMINGGADIYHEYGFKKVVRAEYLGPESKSLKLEIYQMLSPAAAYGIYTFKAGEGGKALKIGQAALLQDYYLNFWKGDLLITLVGQDSDQKTMQGLIALAGAVDARIKQIGERPELASLLLSAPLSFSQLKYVRGPLGVMNSYVFDTKNIFQVREGMLGAVNGCRVFLFQYRDPAECLTAYQAAAAILKNGTRFNGQSWQENRASMVDRDHNQVLINRLGRYMAIVLGQDQVKVETARDTLAGILKND